MLYSLTFLVYSINFLNPVRIQYWDIASKSNPTGTRFYNKFKKNQPSNSKTASFEVDEVSLEPDSTPAKLVLEQKATTAKKKTFFNYKEEAKLLGSNLTIDDFKPKAKSTEPSKDRERNDLSVIHNTSI